MNQARTMQNIPQLVCEHYNGTGMKIIECSMFYNVAHLFTRPSGRVVTKCGVPALIGSEHYYYYLSIERRLPPPVTTASTHRNVDISNQL